MKILVAAAFVAVTFIISALYFSGCQESAVATIIAGATLAIFAGYIANIVKLILMIGGKFRPLLVFRVVGIFLPPVGAVAAFVRN